MPNKNSPKKSSETKSRKPEKVEEPTDISDVHNTSPMDFSLLDDKDEAPDSVPAAEIEDMDTQCQSNDDGTEAEKIPEDKPIEMEVSETSGKAEKPENSSNSGPGSKEAETTPSCPAGAEGSNLEGIPPCVYLSYIKDFEQVLDLEIDKDLLFQKFNEKSKAMQGTIRYLLFAEY